MRFPPTKASRLFGLFAALIIVQTQITCGRATASPGDGGLCEFTTDCTVGWKCTSGQCVKLCNQSSECSSDQECIDGGCLAQDPNACETPEDCTNPSSCEISEGATCTGGLCVYPPDPSCGGLPIGATCNTIDGCADRCLGGACTVDTPSVLLLVNEDFNLWPADAQILSRLESVLGAEVTLRSGTDIELIQDFDLIVISESVFSLSVGTKYQGRSEPMLILEGDLWDEYGLCDQESSGGTWESLDIVAPTDPLAAGLVGEISFSLSPIPDYQYCPTPSVGQNGVVFLSPSSGGAVGLYYEAGQSFLPGQNRMVGLGFHAAAFEDPSITDDGWALFDAAAAWLLIASTL